MDYNDTLYPIEGLECIKIIAGIIDIDVMKRNREWNQLNREFRKLEIKKQCEEYSKIFKLQYQN